MNIHISLSELIFGRLHRERYAFHSSSFIKIECDRERPLEGGQDLLVERTTVLFQLVVNFFRC